MLLSDAVRSKARSASADIRLRTIRNIDRMHDEVQRRVVNDVETKIRTIAAI
jgi:hypothetical protein